MDLNFKETTALFEELQMEAGICFADTCFLMNPNFLEHFYPILNEYNRAHREQPLFLNIQRSCILELISKSTENDRETADRAQKTLDLITKDMNRNHNFVMYESGNSILFLDADLLSVSIMERAKRKVQVFTQDINLTHDLYRLNNLQSYKGKPVDVYRLNLSGIVYSAGNFNADKRQKGCAYVR